MDFDTSKLTTDYGIKLGPDDAPIKVIEYVNWRCPDSRVYELTVAPKLKPYIEKGQVQRVLKHFDKQKPVLEKANLLNQYIDYTDSSEAYNIGRHLIKNQQDWGNLDFKDIPHFAEENGWTLQEDNQIRAQRIQEEIDAVGVEFVPTVFVNEHAFIETFDLDSFIQTIDKELQ